MKPIRWLGNSFNKLKEMPSSVQDTFGYGLQLAQAGQKYYTAKPLKGFPGAGGT